MLREFLNPRSFDFPSFLPSSTSLHTPDKGGEEVVKMSTVATTAERISTRGVIVRLIAGLLGRSRSARFLLVVD